MIIHVIRIRLAPLHSNLKVQANPSQVNGPVRENAGPVWSDMLTNTHECRLLFADAPLLPQISDHDYR